MGASKSWSAKCPGSKEVSNAGFRNSNAGNVEPGSTVANAGGKGYRGDVRKGGGGGKANRKGMSNTY